MRKLFLIITLLLLAIGNVRAQNANNRWQLGYEDINFTNPTPTATTVTAAQNNYGRASISDSAGNLLFYTDGHTIWNKNHAVMTNGDSMWFGTVYDVIILPNPANSNQYYIFKSEELACLCLGRDAVYYGYHVVEFNAANPNGIVLAINSSPVGYIENSYTKMLYNSYSNFVSNTEGFGPLTAAKNHTGDAYWIVTQNGNQICNFKLDASGLNSVPVTSTFLDSQLYNYDSSSPPIGIVGAKFRMTNDNTKLIGLKYSPTVNMNSDPIYWPDTFYKLTFNAQTGVFSSYLQLFNAKTVIGYELSNNSNYVYYTQYTYPAIYPSSVYSKGEITVRDLNNLTTPARILNISGTSTPSSSFSYIQKDKQGNMLVSSVQTNLNRNLYIHKIENQDSFSSSSVLENYVSLNNHSISTLPQLIPTLAAACPNTLLITQNVSTGQDNKQAATSIEATNTISGSSTGAIYHAGTSVVLKPSFRVAAGAKLHAYIAGCTGTFQARQSGDDQAEMDENAAVSKETAQKPAVRISPNPNQGVFNILLADSIQGDLVITDLFGTTIFKSDFKNQKEIEVNIQNQPKGIYIVKIIAANQTYTHKIIKN